ncbi:MAG: hypothetical protein U9Q83_12540 [Bacteroidota bacterium]|nr:hypothetical protein [Bacteroidota bacterium]
MEITGTKKYLIASILFGILGVIFFIKSLILLFVDNNSPVLIFSFGLIVFGALLFYIYKKRSKSNQDYLSKMMALYVGYTFVWLGASFIQGIIPHVLENDNLIIPLILGFLIFILGIPLFIVGLKTLINPSPENIESERKVIRVVSTMAVIIALTPILIIYSRWWFLGQYLYFRNYWSIYLVIYYYKKEKKEKILI